MVNLNEVCCCCMSLWGGSIAFLSLSNSRHHREPQEASSLISFFIVDTFRLRVSIDISFHRSQCVVVNSREFKNLVDILYGREIAIYFQGA